MSWQVLGSEGFAKAFARGLHNENGELSGAGIATISCIITTFFLFSLYVASPYFTPLFFKGYKNLSKHDQADWDTRYGNIIFSVFISYIAGRTVFIDKDFHEDGPVSFHFRSSTNSCIGLGAALGYFLVDTTATVHYMMGGAEMVMHHLAALGSVVNALASGQGHLYTLWMLCTEMTTPFIAMRFLLDKAGFKQHVVYAVNGVGILIFWILARILNFIAFYWHFYVHRDQFPALDLSAKFIVSTIPAFLFALNLFWFGKIVRGVIKLFNRPAAEAAAAGKARGALVADAVEAVAGSRAKEE